MRRVMFRNLETAVIVLLARSMGKGFILKVTTSITTVG